MATRRNTLVARLFPYVGYSCSLLEFQCTRTLRIRLACQVQPGDSCIRLQSRHSFLFSLTLSLPLSLLYSLCKYTPNYAAPHCSCINTSMPRQASRAFHVLHVLETLSHASQNAKRLLFGLLLFQILSPLLTDLAHLLTATLSLSLHVARNDMRLPMLRTDSLAPSPSSSLGIKQHQPTTRHSYGIAATIIYATRAAKKPQISQRFDAQHPQQLQHRAEQQL